MNVLFLDQFNELGGAQLCLCDLLPFVAERGWNVHLAAPGDGPLASAFRRANASVHPLHDRSYCNGRKSPSDVLRFGYDLARDAAAVRTFVRRHSIDVVYVNGPRMLPAAAYSRTAVLFHAHLYLERPYAIATVRWAVRRSGAKVIACSQFIAAWLRRELSDAPVQTIYNGVRRQSAGRLCAPRTGVRVGMIGRIAPDKGQADFLSAAGIVRRSLPDARFVLFGAALFGDAEYEGTIRAMAENVGVELRGWTGDVAASLGELDILVVPSTRPEACPRIVLEAFAAGVPVVAYGCGGIPELLGNDAGVLVETGDVPALAAAIRSLMEHPEDRERLAASGRQAWQHRFTVERFGREVCDAITDCATP